LASRRLVKMKRGFARASAGLLLAVASAVLPSACADNEASLFVQGVMVPSDIDSCEYAAASATSKLLLKSVLDVSAFSQYDALLLVGNQMVQRGNEDKLRAETGNIAVHSADVRIENPEDGGVVAEYQVLTDGLVYASDGTQPGFGSASVLIIDPQTAALMQEALAASPPGALGTLVTNVVLRGRTLGGDEVESKEWSLPVYFCLGCAAGRACADGEQIACGQCITLPECHCVDQ
jgi:hypothetical protein